MKLFTVGPVNMEDYILEQGGKDIPYFRTTDFSEMMLRIQEQFLELTMAEANSKWIPLTASGTGAMEAVVRNVLTPKDKCLVIDGGSFGHRFAQICDCLAIPTERLVLTFGEELTEEKLEPYEGKGFTALLVNLDETSTAQLYDGEMLGAFCRRNHCFFIADAISSFLADELSIQKMGIDVLITASQKALALPPGMSFVVIGPRVLAERVGSVNCGSMYFDFSDYLVNMERGQTPFTPAVGILMQLEQRLDRIQQTGLAHEMEKHKERAAYFRNLCKINKLELPKYPMSNALTAVLFPNKNAGVIFHRMRNEYNMVLTPSGGLLADYVLRVGHLGNLQKKDYDDLIDAMKDAGFI